MLGDPEKGKLMLDTDLEDYMKARDATTATTTAAATTTTTTEKKSE